MHVLATQSCECIKCMFPHGCCFMAMCWLKLVTYHMQHLFHLISSPNHFPLLNVHEHIQLQFQEFCILTKFLSMVQCIMGRNLKIKKKLPNVGWQSTELCPGLPTIVLRMSSTPMQGTKDGMYVEDRYTTQTVLKPSRQFYKWLAGFKTGWPDLIHYVHPGQL